MDLTRVIIGQVVTEKAERLKGSAKTYTLRVDQQATKVDVRCALESFYEVKVESVRMLRTRPKHRRFAGGANSMEKRHRSKRAIVTLTEKSKALDLATFKTA